MSLHATGWHCPGIGFRVRSMDTVVQVPLWVVVLAGLLALLAILDRLLVPSVRWFFRRRVNRIIDEVNSRLDVGIKPFSLTKRQVLIDRLTYDAEVMQEVEQQSRSTNLPQGILMEDVARWAREIVPAFNAIIYFRIGYWLSKRVATGLFRVRLGFIDDDSLRRVADDSTVVFVMNHRSNMDYVLVSFLVAERSVLSYAVGEWARVWVLQSLVRALGAYFVRRNSGDPLYRKVLGRYIAMATEAGVTQAVFPEGRLSRDGLLQEPKLGIFDYMLRSFDSKGKRDILFIPVGINYDRVLEDRTLTGDPAQIGANTAKTGLASLRFVLRNLRLRLLGRGYRFGYACVNFGTPVSVQTFLEQRDVDLAALDKESRIACVRSLANELMAAIGAIVPVLPVPLIATVLMLDPRREFTRAELKADVLDLIRNLLAGAAHVYLPRGNEEYLIDVGLRMLTLRHLVVYQNQRYSVNPEQTKILGFYANSIKHLF
ncbi:MAG: 1-acyl-sn-glycerol-3-phosphate acyltransferase [Gammaproteobacteria bacterium]